MPSRRNDLPAHGCCAVQSHQVVFPRYSGLTPLEKGFLAAPPLGQGPGACVERLPQSTRTSWVDGFSQAGRRVSFARAGAPLLLACPNSSTHERKCLMATTTQESAPRPYSGQGEEDLLPVSGILDVADNHAFLRMSGYLPSPDDIYVALSLLRQHGLRN